MTLAANPTDPFELAADRVHANRALVRFWLYGVVLMLLALVVVGGATRMTNSGLSITEWKPIHGIVPPMNDAEWQEEFSKYRQIPQYETLNRGMALEDFKTIFWWEWAHRALARGIGFVFAVPLVFLVATRRIERALVPRLVGILALGALQGAVGWWMVASGLVGRTDVSQYRLATHLTLAAFIIAATVVVARGLAPSRQPPATRATQQFAGWLVVLVLFQIYLGGLVAGLDAGLSYNTWPLMDGSAVPNGLFVIEPWWRNFFENAKTVQFDHRLGAYLVLTAAFTHMLIVRRADRSGGHWRRAIVLFLIVACQGLVGVATLVMQVPLHAALTHQTLALIVLCVAANHWRATKGSYATLPAGRDRAS